MELIGMLDSPFVRRVAVTARFLGLQYDHKPLSIFTDYDEFRGINPLVKVPSYRTVCRVSSGLNCVARS